MHPQRRQKCVWNSESVCNPCVNTLKCLREDEQVSKCHPMIANWKLHISFQCWQSAITAGLREARGFGEWERKTPRQEHALPPCLRQCCQFHVFLRIPAGLSRNFHSSCQRHNLKSVWTLKNIYRKMSRYNILCDLSFFSSQSWYVARVWGDLLGEC